MLSQISRQLVSVRGIGYRIAEASEHYNVAKTYEQGAKRKQIKALDALQNTRMSEMTQAERARHEAYTMVLSDHHYRLDALEKRQTSLENAILKTLYPNGKKPDIEGEAEPVGDEG